MTKGRYKNPDLPRWGIRKFWASSRGGLIHMVVWHREEPVMNQYLIACNMTHAQAKSMCRLISTGRLGT